MTLTAKVHPTRRDGKSYPVIEVDAIDLVVQYLEHCGIDQFVADFIGCDRFLEAAVEAIKNTYTSPSCDSNVHKAKGELLKALGQDYVVGMANSAASNITSADYYRRQYQDLYYLFQALNHYDAPDNVRSAFDVFLKAFREKHVEPRIADKAWDATRQEALTIMKNELLERVEVEHRATNYLKRLLAGEPLDLVQVQIVLEAGNTVDLSKENDDDLIA